MDGRSVILAISEALGVIATCIIAGSGGRLAHKPIGYLYTRREVLYAGSLSLYLILLAWGVHASGFLQQTLSPLSPHLNLVLIALAAAVPFIIITLLRKQPAKSLGWSPATRSAGLRLGIMLMFLVLFLSGKIFTLIKTVGPKELNILLAWLLISLLEETLFRGFIQQRLVWAYKKPLGFLLTALVFTLFRLPALGLTRDLFAYQVGYTLLQSLLLSWVMEKSGHVLSPALYRAVSTWLSTLP